VLTEVYLNFGTTRLAYVKNIKTATHRVDMAGEERPNHEVNLPAAGEPQLVTVHFDSLVVFTTRRATTTFEVDGERRRQRHVSVNPDDHDQRR